MIRVHKIKLEPTAAQEDYFRRACGTARFAYNWALAEWDRQRKAGEKPTEAALRKQLNAIKTEQFPWMSEVTKNAPQQAIKNVGLAFQHFFRRVKLKQKPGYPRFKQKGIRDSFRADNGPGTFSTDGKVLKLPRVGGIRMREQLRFVGVAKSAAVSRMADGWYVSISVETETRLQAVANKGACGVDLGVNTLAAIASGSGVEVVPALRPHRAAHKRLVRLSRSLSRKVKGSANRAKAKAKLARLHLRIANVRKDALHKLTTGLATRYSTIGIEDLNVRGMMGGNLARSVADVGFHEFRRQLEYKAAMTGAQVIVLDRFFPSSQLCSRCGERHPEMTRRGGNASRMVCRCGCNTDRDENAAINIMRQALACQSVESEALASAQAETKLHPVKQETEGCAAMRRRGRAAWSPLPALLAAKEVKQ